MALDLGVDGGSVDKLACQSAQGGGASICHHPLRQIASGPGADMEFQATPCFWKYNTDNISEDETGLGYTEVDREADIFVVVETLCRSHQSCRRKVNGLVGKFFTQGENEEILAQRFHITVLSENLRQVVWWATEK